MKTAGFDFELPPELIAQHPAAERSASRLLDGRDAVPVDRVFRDLWAVRTMLLPRELVSAPEGAAFYGFATAPR